MASQIFKAAGLFWRSGLHFFGSFSRPVISPRWVILIVLSAVFARALEALRLPAALLLGPMIAAILAALSDKGVRIPPYAVLVAQGVIGCLIARSIPPAIISEISSDWPLFLAVAAAVIAASSTLGWLLTRWRVLPGTTAVWGSSPGAATAMMLMAAAYGADIRLVAFMQYIRVLFVAVAATVVARLWTRHAAGPPAAFIWFPPIAWAGFAGTLMLIGLGVTSARFRRIPAGPLLVPLALGMTLRDAGWLTIELPPWLLVISYALVGWNIGLGFNRAILAHAARALPRVIMAILVLMAVCGGLAALLVVVTGVDPLTAYLATSPGGADSAAIIAMASNVDVAFVMAMQTTRLILVLLIGPSLARFIASQTSTAKTIRSDR